MAAVALSAPAKSQPGTNVPALTGVFRHHGIVRAHFQSSGGGPAFFLTPGSEWGQYRLESLNTKVGEAIVWEGDHRLVLHFPDSSAHSNPGTNTPLARVPHRPETSPLSEEDDLYRTRWGQEALEKLEYERLVRRQALARGLAVDGPADIPPPDAPPDVEASRNPRDGH